MTTNQPSSLAEIKEKAIREHNEQGFNSWNEYHGCDDKEDIEKFLSSVIDQSYELGRSVGRAELLSEIKGIIAESKGDEMIVLAGLLNKLTLK